MNWTQLIRSLTEMDMITSEANIQIYFYTALIKGLRGLEKFSKEDPIGLNNAILGLYAHKLYQEVINDILCKLFYSLLNNLNICLIIKRDIKVFKIIKAEVI